MPRALSLTKGLCQGREEPNDPTFHTLPAPMGSMQAPRWASPRVLSQCNTGCLSSTLQEPGPLLLLSAHTGEARQRGSFGAPTHTLTLTTITLHQNAAPLLSLGKRELLTEVAICGMKTYVLYGSLIFFHSRCPEVPTCSSSSFT